MLIAWGDPPSIFGPNFNPNDPKEQESQEMKMELRYTIPFLNFLGVGLAISVAAMAVELSVAYFMTKVFKYVY